MIILHLPRLLPFQLEMRKWTQLRVEWIDISVLRAVNFRRVTKSYQTCFKTGGFEQTGGRRFSFIFEHC